MKIAVVGGASTYTPELVDGFARLFPAAELCLVDPAADRLSVVGPFAARIFAHYGAAGRVTWTQDIDAGLTDASVQRATRPAAPTCGERITIAAGS